MNEPTAILVAGDWHGDAAHAARSVEHALYEAVQAIVQVGDFGYWEHYPGGAEFLDQCSALAMTHNMPIYWIDGNHENHTMLRAVYGPGGERHRPTAEGFWEIRDGLYYIPRGTRWQWSGMQLMGLGGAYSVDRDYRLEREHKRYLNHEYANRQRTKAGHPTRPFDPARWKEWWPEEEITDEELTDALTNPEPVDVLFTHDKPRASNPPWNRKAFEECLPNQDRIQTVVRTLHPKLLVHGHLHYRYRDTIRCGDDDQHCRVEGLSCNDDALAFPPRSQGESWLTVDLANLVP